MSSPERLECLRKLQLADRLAQLTLYASGYSPAVALGRQTQSMSTAKAAAQKQTLVGLLSRQCAWYLRTCSVSHLSSGGTVGFVILRRLVLIYMSCCIREDMLIIELNCESAICLDLLLLDPAVRNPLHPDPPNSGLID